LPESLANHPSVPGAAHKLAPAPVSPVPSFGSLARRIASWTTNGLLSLIVLLVALVFGREVIRAWRVGPEEQSARRLAIPGGAADADLPRLIQFGSFPGTLGRRPFEGDRKAALAALRGVCRQTVDSSPLPGKPATEEERRFLDRMARTAPVEQDPDHWRIYQLDVAMPMVAVVRLLGATGGLSEREATADKPAASLDKPAVAPGDTAEKASSGTRRGSSGARVAGNRDSPVAPRACRVVTWGMAAPVTENAWTLYVFSPGASSLDGGVAKEIPIPPGGSRLLSIQVAGGGRMVSFKGHATPDAWTRFYDSWLLANDWRPEGPWRHRGSIWGLHCESKSAPGGGLDLEFVEDQTGQLTGLLFYTIQRLQ
jgi:hypothetical protein